MIPADQVNPAAVQALHEYLIREIYATLSDRRPLEQRWRKFEQAYRALPEVDVKEFPFLGAANLVIPVVATDVDTIFARIMGILFAPENLWSARALKPEMVDYAPRVKEFLQWAQNNELNAYDAIADWVLEICKLGTGILKQRYRREVKWGFHYRETAQGVVQQVRESMVKDHPIIEHVPLERFLIPATAVDIQSAPWCAELVSLTWEQYMSRIEAGIYMYSERIMRSHAHERAPFIVQEKQRLDAFKPGMGDKLDFWECWLDFDVSGMNRRMPIVATIHLPSQTIVRLDYNPYLNQERPYSSARFLRQSNRFLGIGLAEMLTPVQDEVSAMHNQRIDAGTIANAPMFEAPRGIGIQENEPIWPGRFFLTDSPGTIKPIQFQGKFDPSVNYETLTMDYARRRTGVNDYMAGAANAATGYATATTSVHLLQEAARKIDQTLREIRNAIGESGTRVLELYQQFNQAGKIFAVMGPKDGAMMQQILSFPMEMMRYSIGIETTATSAALNKEVEIRTNMIVTELLSNFYQQLFQGMAIVVNPQMPPPMRQLAIQMIQGGILLMRRTLDSYGIQDVDRLVPNPMEAQNGPAGALPPAFGGAQGVPPAMVGPAPGQPIQPALNGANGAAPVAAGGVGGRF